jgi:alpha-N-arabinofuranosidase
LAILYPLSTAAQPNLQYRRGANSMPMVDITAVRDRKSKLVWAIVNSDPDRPAHLTTNPTCTAHRCILTGRAIDTHNTFDAPNDIHPMSFQAGNDAGKIALDVPSKSMVSVEVEWPTRKTRTT